MDDLETLRRKLYDVLTRYSVLSIYEFLKRRFRINEDRFIKEMYRRGIEPEFVVRFLKNPRKYLEVKRDDEKLDTLARYFIGRFLKSLLYATPQ